MVIHPLFSQLAITDKILISVIIYMNTSDAKYDNIDHYISEFPKNIQEKLTQIRECIKELVPQATEAISYGMPTFKLNGKNLIHFAGFKNHIGLYPFPSGIQAFKDETKDYVTSTGTIQFELDKPLPMDLITRIVQFRVQENSENAGKKGY